MACASGGAVARERTMSAFKFGQLAIDPVALGSAGNAILGIRDSGKTYTATLLAEHLFDAGIPFVAFDPIGVWRFLRVPGKGRGYPIVVAGGQHGDLPLSPHSAPAIVEAAMQNGVSLVLDLFSLELSKADWKRIVRDSVKLMLHKNGPHGLRHIFVEEAAEFAPQVVRDGDVYAEMEKLARMGGNARLGYTLINQRAEEVNKALLELCDNLFLHRQKGRNSLTALSKWLDIGAVKDHRQIIDTLSTLPTGECWAWLAGTERPVHVKVPQKNSLHPDRRVMRGDTEIATKATVDVGKFVETMRSTLTTVEDEAKANDPKLLRARIGQLERELARADGGATPADLATEYARGRADGFDAALAGLTPFIERAVTLQAAIDEQLGGFVDDLRRRARGAESREPGAAHAQRHESPAPAPRTRAPSAPRRPIEGVSRSQQKIMESLAMLESMGIQQPSRTQLALWAEVSPTSGGYFNNLGALRTAGLIDYPSGGTVELTAAGRDRAPTPEPMSLDEMQEALCARVGASKAAILRALISIYPKSITRDKLAEKIDVSATSGGYFNNLGALRTLGVIEYPSPGHVVALPVLFAE